MSNKELEKNERPLLVSREYLDAAIADDEDVLLLDAAGAKRWEDGRFRAVTGGAEKKLPGVPRFDIVAVGECRDAEALNPIPDAGELKEYLAGLGAGPDTWIVFTYVDSFGWATRARWLLRLNGWSKVSVLGNGDSVWAETGEAIYVSTADVEQALASGSAKVIDVRGSKEFAGAGFAPDYEGYPGRMPGAVNLPIGKLADASGSLRPIPELSELMGPVLNEERPVIATCGGGVAATALAFAAELCGKGDVAVYDGSIHAWTADPSRPIERDE